jgi:hypothetical protein
VAAAGGRRLRSLAGVLATLTLLASSIGSSAAAQTSSPFAPADDPVPEGTTITLTSVTPVVDASSGTTDAPAEATIQGRITNRGTGTLDRPTVSVVRGDAPVDRAGIQRWAGSSEPSAGTLLDDTTLRSVAPGQSTSFTLTVPASDLAPRTVVGGSRR